MKRKTSLHDMATYTMGAGTGMRTGLRRSSDAISIIIAAYSKHIYLVSSQACHFEPPAVEQQF